MKKIAWIGLGIMGKPMSKNLLKAGYALRVYDISESAVKEVSEAGAVGCKTIAEAIEGSDIIITMLPNSPHVKSVALEKGGILDNAKKGTLYVDMSSIAPLAAQEVAAALEKKGIRMVDAPVSGGEPKAIDGSLAIMVGGAQADFDEALPIFEVLGASAVLVGAIGSGNTCKLANQIIVALNIAAVSEAMVLAKKAGTDPQKVFDAIKGGLAGSTVMNAKTPMMLSRNFKPGFKIDLHIKDINNALETAQGVHAPMILTAEIMQILQAVKLDGCGQEDHSAIVKFYEKISQTEVVPN